VGQKAIVRNEVGQIVVLDNGSRSRFKQTDC